MSKRSRKNKLRKVKKARKVKKTRKVKKVRKVKKFAKKNYITEDSEGNTLIKVSEVWAKQALVNKSKYQKNINYL